MCPSWPQACIRPSISEPYSRPATSWIGNASMSARSSTAGLRAPAERAGCRPRPVSAMPSRTSIDSASRRSSTNAAVQVSSNPSSGWRCSARRHATSSPASASAAAAQIVRLRRAHSIRLMMCQPNGLFPGWYLAIPTSPTSSEKATSPKLVTMSGARHRIGQQRGVAVGQPVDARDSCRRCTP